MRALVALFLNRSYVLLWRTENSYLTNYTILMHVKQSMKMVYQYYYMEYLCYILTSF